MELEWNRFGGSCYFVVGVLCRSCGDEVIGEYVVILYCLIVRDI
jgi:hypothetical protein